MDKPIPEQDEWVFTASDVKRLYISMRPRLIRWAAWGALFAFVAVCIQTPTYKAEASFKEGVEESSSDSILKELMSGLHQTHQPQASSFMRSNQVLKPLVEKMGLQIVPADQQRLIPKVIHRFRENLRAEIGSLLKDPDPFIFENVFYESGQLCTFYIRFMDETHFAVYLKDKKMEIAQGILGNSVALPDLQFTLSKVPQKLKIGSFYPFRVVDWLSAIKSLQDDLTIKSDKDNKSLIKISFAHRDRHLAASVVNELMNQYQAYLKRDYDHTAESQIAYLENKQKQIFSEIANLFDQHCDYLNQNLKEHGFIGIKEEFTNILAPYQEMSNKLTSIDLELSQLDQMEKQGKIVTLFEESPFSQRLNQIVQKTQDLKQERDLLELSLCHVTEHALDEKREELKDVRNQRFAVERLIQEIDRGEEISSFDVDQSLCLWAKTVQNPEEREDFAQYLENYARLLSLREKLLQERFIFGIDAPTELEGIDHSVARRLFIEYNTKLDTAEASMRYYAQLKKEIANPLFDLSSLSSILKDPLSEKLIGEAGNLAIQLKDEKHHSLKEGQRWEEEIALNRRILSDHLDQLYKVEELNADLIHEKMAGLQKVSLDSINRQLSVLNEQTADSIKQQRQALFAERSLLNEKMEKMRLQLAKVLPEKWRYEKWLSLKTDLVSKIMETVTEVVESKTISTHLHHVESKPLDCAPNLTFPQPPKICQKMLIASVLSPFLLFCFVLIRQIMRGFPSSLEKLKAMKFPVLGSISAFCDGPSVETPKGPDLDLLRRLALFAQGGKVISLIEGRGPDYSYALAENLARMSAKSIVLRCDFLSKYQKEDAPGLLQIWKGESAELPICKGNGFDYIPAGGYSPFGTEIIQSQSFVNLVDILKKNYDWIFLLCRSPLSAAESLAALNLCEKAVVTVSGEPTEELTPFIDWAYHNNDCRLTFITEI